jgi:hypothetical protein
MSHGPQRVFGPVSQLIMDDNKRATLNLGTTGGGISYAAIQLRLTGVDHKKPT